MRWQCKSIQVVLAVFIEISGMICDQEIVTSHQLDVPIVFVFMVYKSES